MWTINYRLYFYPEKKMLCRKLDGFENRLFFLRANVADFEEILSVFSHKKYFGSQSLSQPCDSSIGKCSVHVRGCYALKIHFIVCLILSRERIWLEHKSTLKQIIYVIFTLKNSLLPLKCLSAYWSQKETTSMPSEWWVTPRLTYLQVFQELS